MWIKVTDKMPERVENSEHSYSVLVTDGFGIDVANYYYKYWSYWYVNENSMGFSRVDPDKITHWMPLPDLPKDD